MEVIGPLCWFPQNSVFYIESQNLISFDGTRALTLVSIKRFYILRVVVNTREKQAKRTTQFSSFYYPFDQQKVNPIHIHLLGRRVCACTSNNFVDCRALD